jgi:hypothetical protein
LRAIRTRRRASHLADLFKIGTWLMGLAAVVTIAGGILIGSR